MEINTENTNQQSEEKQNNYTQMSMFEKENADENSENGTNCLNQTENGNLSEVLQTETKAETKKMLEASGLSYSDLQKEYNATGMISKESREKLSKSGITNEFVDEYIKGQQAVLESELNEISQCIGGRQNLNTVLKWAEKNLAEPEKISINTIHDKNLMKIILKDLKNRMEEKEGITPNYVKGGSAKVFSGVFRSKAEMYEAISNPKYKKDEAYRSDVQRKISASMRAGIDLGI